MKTMRRRIKRRQHDDDDGTDDGDNKEENEGQDDDKEDSTDEWAEGCNKEAEHELKSEEQNESRQDLMRTKGSTDERAKSCENKRRNMKVLKGDKKGGKS